jgi:hypothetical protein
MMNSAQRGALPETFKDSVLVEEQYASKETDLILRRRLMTIRPFGKTVVGLAILVFLLTLNVGAVVAATSCESLASLSLPNASRTSTTTVEAGAFVPAAGERGPARSDPYKTMPAFCRIQVTLKPTTDSDIKTEVWLPISG